MQVIHDYPESEKDIPVLRNKGILVAHSIVYNFTDYVNYDRAMSTYRALSRLSDMSNTILYMVSPNSQQVSSQGQNMLLGLSEYIQRYYEYWNPSNLLPPFGGNVYRSSIKRPTKRVMMIPILFVITRMRVCVCVFFPSKQYKA